MLSCLLTLEDSTWPLSLPDNHWSPAIGQGIAFYCPFCPGLWGVLRIKDYKYFSCREMSCSKCNIRTGSCTVPGSLTDALWEGCLDYLPIDLVRREAELTLKAFENEQPSSDLSSILAACV